MGGVGLDQITWHRCWLQRSRNHSIDWVNTNGNHVDRDDQSGDNVALLTFGRALFNLEQLVNTFYQLEHNAAEDGEELRK
jgi:hypothetical protein